MDKEMEAVLQVYRRICMDRLHEQKHRKRATINQIGKIYRLIDDCQDWGVAEQVQRDLRVYMLYDCLAMWADLHGGLAKYVPETILRVLQGFISYKCVMLYASKPDIFKDVRDALQHMRRY